MKYLFSALLLISSGVAMAESSSMSHNPNTHTVTEITQSPHKISSFRAAKNTLKKLYRTQPKTFYCGCDIEWQTSKKLTPSVNRCGYSPRKPKTRKGKDNQRAQRIEWEHLVPAWEFGRQLPCWQKGGRKACKTDFVFKQMESDLHNLVPAIGEVNGDRSNFKFSVIASEPRVYGQCDAEVDFKARIFEPTDSVRGNIARTYFYFESRYGLKISKKQKQLFNAWHQYDPVDKAECEMHAKKQKKQGNSNRFVEMQCKAHSQYSLLQ